MGQRRNASVSGGEESQSRRWILSILATVAAALVATYVAVPSAYAAVTVPGAPTAVKATPGNRSAVVKWTAPTDNGGSAITGYVVKALLVDASSGQTCKTIGATTCTVIGLLNRSIYNVTVRALNIRGKGPWSAPIQVTPGVPGRPKIVFLARGDGYVTVGWLVAPSNGSPITQYTVTSSPGAMTSSTPAGNTECNVTGLTDGTPYTFTVTATNSRGTGAPSAPSASIIPASVQTIAVGSANYVSSDGADAWVSAGYANTVAELNASDGTVIQTIAVGSEPEGVSSDGTHVWVTNTGDNTVTELNASDGSVIQAIAVGSKPQYVSSDGIHVWVINAGNGTITEVDASDGKVLQVIPVGSPSGVASDGTHVWVTNAAGNSVTELNTSDGALVQTISVGLGPVGVSSDGTHVWVTSYFENAVTELNASDGSVVQTIAVGRYPRGVSSDGAHVWVANGGDGTVTEFAA